MRRRSHGGLLDSFRGAATLYMATTGVGYSLLLGETLLLGWVNFVLHYLMPVALILDWAVDRPTRTIPFRRAIAWMALPVAFYFHTLSRGEIVDWYPYPFLDVGERGYPAVLVTGAALGAGLLGLTWLLVHSTRWRPAAAGAASRA